MKKSITSILLYFIIHSGAFASEKVYFHMTNLDEANPVPFVATLIIGKKNKITLETDKKIISKQSKGNKGFQKGLIMEISPKFKGDKYILSGKFIEKTFLRNNNKENKLSTMTFITNETVFSGNIFAKEEVHLKIQRIASKPFSIKFYLYKGRKS